MFNSSSKIHQPLLRKCKAVACIHGQGWAKHQTSAADGQKAGHNLHPGGLRDQVPKVINIGSGFECLDPQFSRRSVCNSSSWKLHYRPLDGHSWICILASGVRQHHLITTNQFEHPIIFLFTFRPCSTGVFACDVFTAEAIELRMNLATFSPPPFAVMWPLKTPRLRVHVLQRKSCRRSSHAMLRSGRSLSSVVQLLFVFWTEQRRKGTEQRRKGFTSNRSVTTASEGTSAVDRKRTQRNFPSLRKRPPVVIWKLEVEIRQLI